MTKILALAGRKSSGKNTAVNFLLGVYMLGLRVVHNSTQITPEGQLLISDLFGDENITGIFDIYREDNEQIVNLLEQHIHPYIKVYSFANLLKHNVCMNILGLSYEQYYGTEKQKNTKTHLKWENMPDIGKYPMHPQTGHMTARNVMQYVGTNIFRNMYGNVWVDATIRRIQSENSDLAVITDCRFPNEVDGVQKAGGRVIYLTRNPYEDKHTSETALDEENFDRNKFDAVIDNAKMTIEEQNEALYNILRPWDYIPEVLTG